MSQFRNSKYFGSRVEKAKSEKGWLSNQEFDRLSRQEYQEWRASQRIGCGSIVLIIFGLCVVFTMWELLAVHHGLTAISRHTF